MKYNKRYTKTSNKKTEIFKMRLDEHQKNDLIRWAFNEGKTVSQCVLEAIKKKRKEFPI